MKEWFYLISAIVFEVAGTTSMKLSDGLTKIAPSVFVFLFYFISFAFLALALKRLDISIAYAIWSAIGLTLIALIGIAYFKEEINTLKIGSMILIIVGIIGLNLSIRH